MLAKLQPATKVDAGKHEKALADLKEREAEVDRLEDALARAQEQYAELEKLKDKEQVKALNKKKPGSQAVQKEFDELIEAVGDAKPRASKVVLKHIIADHFGRAGRIDWFSDRQEFEDAVKYGLITPENDHVEWGREKLRPLRKALEAVQAFLDSEDGAKWHKQQEAHVPTDPDDLEFWEYHLDL